MTDRDLGADRAGAARDLDADRKFGADRDLDAHADLTVDVRPRRARVVCWLTAASVVVVCTLVSFGLTGPTGDGQGYFQPGDQAAMIGLGLLIAGLILVFTRLRVTADAGGIRVRNLVGQYDLPWALVREVRFDRGAAWAQLELQDDEVLALMAVQRADKEYALAAVRALRRLLAEAPAGPPARPGPAGQAGTAGPAGRAGTAG